MMTENHSQDTFLFAGQYRSIKALGCGSNGSVDLVQDVKTGAEYALKSISTTKIVATTDLEGFQSEFETLKNLNHPSICQVYDAGHDRNHECYYLVTELVKGVDLFKATEELTFSEIEDLFVQALRAFNYLHQNNVIHLDVKPQNLLVETRDNRHQLKIIDFGFANFFKRKRYNEERKTPLIIGTAAYVAPEIIQGKPFDKRADLYSLGITFYKAFARRIPFGGPTAAIVHEMHLKEKPDKPTEINDKLPKYIDSILLKLLEKDPDKRYQTAEEVIKDLFLYSENSYEVETQDTLTCYVPEKGRLIGREEEFKKFENTYHNRLDLNKLDTKPYFIITGNKGTGKTRFLKEVENFTKKNLVNVVCWEDFEKIPLNEIKKPAVVVGDLANVSGEYLQFLETVCEKHSVLMVVTMASFDGSCQPEHLVELKNFNFNQTRTYLKTATGQPNIPSKIVDIIFARTQGNPACLTEHVKHLFRKGVLRDIYGNWSDEDLEELTDYLEQTDVDDYTKNAAKESLNYGGLSQDQRTALVVLALLNRVGWKVSRADMEELVTRVIPDKTENQEIVLSLLNAGIIEEKNEKLIFSNLVCRDLVFDEIDQEMNNKAGSNLANYLEEKNASQEQILYFRARGGTERKEKTLWDLAVIQRRNAHLQEAQQTLSCLLRRELDPLLHQEAVLEMADVEVELGNYDAVLKRLSEAVSDSRFESAYFLARAFDLMGICFQRMSDHEKAIKCFSKGLVAIENLMDLKWLSVILNNRKIHSEYAMSHVAEAEKIAEMAYSLWLNELNEEEKVKAAGVEKGVVLFSQRKYDQAILFLEEQCHYLEKTPWLWTYHRVLFYLGAAYSNTKKFDLANKFLLRCVEILKARKNDLWIYVVYNELATVGLLMGDVERAVRYYKKAFVASSRAGKQANYIVAFNMANVFHKNQDLQEAHKYYTYVLKMTKECADEKHWLELYHYFMTGLELVGVSMKTGNLDEAERLINLSAGLLIKNSSLKRIEQYYWEQKILLDKKLGRNEKYEESMKKLDELKNTKDFNMEAYNTWLNSEFLTEGQPA